MAVLRSAADTLIVGGWRLSLSTYLWRDSMPTGASDGRPLVAVLTICAAGTAKLPGSISCDAVWIVHDQETWKAWLQSETAGSVRPNQISRTVRDGPEWGPKIFVMSSFAWVTHPVRRAFFAHPINGLNGSTECFLIQPTWKWKGNRRPPRGNLSGDSGLMKKVGPPLVATSDRETISG